ncbi:hypothetical protein PCORN_15121 [Listeria cornellensis FSL F6-0969]|uniref:Uncharacterized protein n=1 Tax=Listeria cornellensis FSL F6-0969 TaxID=1265820 RepID=W7BKD8_9LIST|nr:hypothetical protein PCORN_15121 [Listeria cornellensis FSL F6-0969]
MVKFNELEHEGLNCGWCTTGGVVGGIVVIGGIVVLT